MPEFGPAGSRDPLQAIYDDERRRPLRRRMFAAAAAVLVLGAFAAIVYYAYHEGVRAGSGGVAPLIKAETQPYKVKPENPGGMEVPNKDKLIYNEIAPNGKSIDQGGAEHLLPPPETPMARPTAEAPAAPPSSASETASAAPGPAAPSTTANAPAPQNAAPAGSTAPATPPASAPQGQSATTNAAPIAATPPAPANAPAHSQTASAASAPAAGAGGWRVQLGAMRSAAEAEHEWERLRRAHSALLGSLKLKVQKVAVAGKGDFYRIQGGPLADREAASALCERLKNAHVACFPVKP
ncbi:MAG TPA: SPOR domain-containing protein [Alphaproteobacteria bacterium]|nr:SPOR domain-containing protein [Alphaproteobacteria bacterium]